MIAAWVIKKLSENGISVQPLPADKDTYNANSDAWLGPDYDGVNGTAGFDIVISETWGPNYDPSTKLFDMTYEWGTETLPGHPDRPAQECALPTSHCQAQSRRPQQARVWFSVWSHPI